MSNPTVSVVMGVYNGADYLRECMESVLNQEGVDLEFVVVDDGSTDESPHILNEFAARDPRVRLIQQKNTGLTRALIIGCAAAKGEYIARQDADDRSLPGRLRRQVDELRERRMRFISSWVRRVGPVGEFVDNVTLPGTQEEICRRLRDENYGVPCHGSVMFEKSLYTDVGGYRGQFYFAQDADLWSRMIEVAEYSCIPEPLYELRWRMGSISGTRTDLQAEFHRLGQLCRIARRTNSTEEEFLESAQRLCETARRPPDSNRSSLNQSVAAYVLGTTLLRNGNRAGRNYLHTAIHHNPTNLKAWARLVAAYLGCGSSPSLK